MKYSLDDTIVGIATGVSNSGVSILRISGQDSFSILKKIFRGKSDIDNAKSHTLHYGFIFENDLKIDEVLVSIMKSPHSYTTENVVEVNCHGGIVTTQRVLNTIIKNGARLASAGEFTKRAFLNGRIDLAKAEAISYLITAKSEREQEIALNQLSGTLSNEIIGYRNQILKLIATSEASIDYPEHDMEHDNISEISKTTKIIIDKLNILAKSSKQGKLIRDGIETVIIGKPNVGKSSLLNRLAGKEIAIVTSTPGTTRDAISEYININGLILKIVDTAGIRETLDEVEKIGVAKSKEKALQGELILFLIDGSQNITKDDFEILEFIKEKNCIVIINKSDLTQNADIRQIENLVGKENICYTSALKNDIEGLYSIINKMFLDGIIENESNNLIINSRHESLILSALESLFQVMQGIKFGMSEDLLVIDLMDSYEFLGAIIGESLDDDIIDKIFSQFCLGK